MTNKKKRKFKMMTYIFIFLIFTFGIYVHLGRKLPNMNEGMWEITLETKMPGAQMSIPVKHSQVLTKAEPFPDISIPGYNCRLFRKRHPVNIIWNFVLWKVHCEGPEPVIKGNAHIRYSGDTLKGNVQMHTIEDNQKRFNTYISGFRTGDSK
jgi:hypothetical protein